MSDIFLLFDNLIVAELSLFRYILEQVFFILYLIIDRYFYFVFLL